MIALPLTGLLLVAVLLLVGWAESPPSTQESAAKCGDDKVVAP